MEQPVSGRARRFPLDVPVRYRMLGSTTWEVGEARNISSSGILFSADAGFVVHTGVEIAFDLPTTIPPAHVVCRGRVARIAPGEPGVSCFTVALTIAQYGFSTAPPHRGD